MKIPTGPEGEESVDLINLTPLLDIVFNLIIFFMVTTQFQEDERDLKIKLPESENAESAQQTPRTLLVNVRQDGRFSVGDKVLDRDELKRALARAKTDDPQQKVLMRVDKDTPFRHPVVVFDICKGLDIDTSLATVDGAAH